MCVRDFEADQPGESVEFDEWESDSDGVDISEFVPKEIGKVDRNRANHILARYNLSPVGKDDPSDLEDQAERYRPDGTLDVRVFLSLQRLRLDQETFVEEVLGIKRTISEHCLYMRMSDKKRKQMRSSSLFRQSILWLLQTRPNLNPGRDWNQSKCSTARQSTRRVARPNQTTQFKMDLKNRQRKSLRSKMMRN